MASSASESCHQDGITPHLWVKEKNEGQFLNTEA